MGINNDRPSGTGGFSTGDKTVSANKLNTISQYLDQRRAGIHSGNVRPSETAGGTLFEVDVGRRRGAKTATTYHPWQIVPSYTEAGLRQFSVWPATVNNLVPKFMGKKLDDATKPVKPVQEGFYYIWLEVRGQQGSGGTSYTFPKEDGETPLIVVDQQSTKGDYDDKAYLAIGTIRWEKAVKAAPASGGTPAVEAKGEVFMINQYATISTWVERMKCGQSTATYFWSI